jgi:hypothetical protein
MQGLDRVAYKLYLAISDANWEKLQASLYTSAFITVSIALILHTFLHF